MLNLTDEPADTQEHAEMHAEKSPAQHDHRRTLVKQIDSLRCEKAYYQAILAAAAADTFGLALNLRDSLFSLTIKGVPVRQCRVYRFHSSTAFDFLRKNGRLCDYHASPLLLERDFATIKKIPIKVIRAPKDTTEAYEYMNRMLRLERPDVYYRLFFDRDIVLDIRQTGRPSLRGALRRLGYSFQWRFYALLEDIKTLLRGSVPGHRLWIRIRLDNDDAKAIYRSLQGDIRLVLLM